MASTNITFSNIPASIRKPGKYFEYNTRMAVNTLPANAQKMLIVGQRLTGGSVPALTPTQVYSSAQAADYFGAGSMLHRMVLAAITANAYLDLTVCALDDGAGAAATDTVTIAGTATGAGVLTLSVGNQSCQIAIAATDAAAAKATALQAALAQISSLPVAATVNAAVVTLTSKNKRPRRKPDRHSGLLHRPRADSNTCQPNAHRRHHRPGYLDCAYQGLRPAVHHHLHTL